MSDGAEGRLSVFGPLRQMLMSCSPYGKLVQKGHARMFYNVSEG